MAEVVVVTLVVEKETPRMMRFEEVVMTPGSDPTPVAAKQAVCKKLYVSKTAHKKLGNPKAVRVTLEGLA